MGLFIGIGRETKKTTAFTILDGGISTTTSFNNFFDGGSASTISFDLTIDGGNSVS